MQFAKNCGVSTMLITGKGEPTLYTNDIVKVLALANTQRAFPFIELQTNGIRLADEKLDKEMARWYKLGLNTIILSIVHYEDEMNKKIYGEKYPNLEKLIEKLHRIGFSVRLSCIMVKDYIDSINKIKQLIAFCKANKVEQLTIRPVTAPDRDINNKEVYEWTKEHSVLPYVYMPIFADIENNGTLLMNLMHGARVYDLYGQNICISNCLTESTNAEEIRQLIYFPDGHLRYSWVHEGAIIL